MNRHSLGFSTSSASPSASFVINQNRRHSSSVNLDRTHRSPNETLFETLMADPVKRALVLQLLSQEKTTIEEYQKNGSQNSSRHPVKKVQDKFRCESPSALLRRRMLEKQRQENNNSCVSSTELSPSLSPLPFEKLLEGIVAYVEIRSLDGDRSIGTKAIMATMGATINEKFTRDVTHVIFKVRNTVFKITHVQGVTTVISYIS